MRRRAGLAVQMLEPDGALAMGAEHVDLGVEGGKRDGPVARIDRDAGLAPTEQRMTAVDAADCRAPAPGLALVAGKGLAETEIGTARALQQIAADRCHVAQLLRRRPP